MKTKDELNALKAEFEALNLKLKELSEEELQQVTGGDDSATNRGRSPLPPHYPGQLD